MPAPHPPLPRYYPTEADRSRWVRGIFDRTAGDYDRVERVLGLGSGSWYRRQALRRAGLRTGMTVLDVGTGTGLVAREAATLVGDATRVTGVDPSSGMVGHARVPAGVRLLAGSAEAIPAADGTADFLSMGYALRHISNLRPAFAVERCGRVNVLGRDLEAEGPGDQRRELATHARHGGGGPRGPDQVCVFCHRVSLKGNSSIIQVRCS